MARFAARGAGEPGARAGRLFAARLSEAAHHEGVELPFTANTPYINTIPDSKQPPYPGNREMERRIKSIIRWNAMAMVVRANKDASLGIGGHISTFASAATLYEVAFNHFFRGKGERLLRRPDLFPGARRAGHLRPGVSRRPAERTAPGKFPPRAGRRRRAVELSASLADARASGNFRPSRWAWRRSWRSTRPASINICTTAASRRPRSSHVWAFLGDGETDEPETLGAITLAGREELDNLIFVINCNLQRLDGPVRGNGKIIQELEGIFRGAGWNVIKVIWGDNWDPLLAKDKHGLLVQRMGEVVDGEYQKYTVMPGAYIREHFFGKYPELEQMVRGLSDEELKKLRRGGHDPEKVYAAYKAAVETQGQADRDPGQDHQGLWPGRSRRRPQHHPSAEEAERKRAARNSAPASAFRFPTSEVSKAPFYKPAEDSEEMQYLKARRAGAGRLCPDARRPSRCRPKCPGWNNTANSPRAAANAKPRRRWPSSTFCASCSRTKRSASTSCRSVPDESRTFGMEGLFRQCGIYAHAGQLYEPVDSGMLLYYREAKDGQILEEGITEAGSMASFIAAGTAYSSHGINMIPFFIYYSMFGFQRIGDLIWAACDCRAKGFLLGGTAGRTTLAGEGLQHQDGHSLLDRDGLSDRPLATTRPSPTRRRSSCSTACGGCTKRTKRRSTTSRWKTKTTASRRCPRGRRRRSCKGIYKFGSKDAGAGGPRVQLFGSGAILREVLRAQEILAEKYGVSSDVWSVTSYTELARDCEATERWNMLHPTEKPRQSFLEKQLAGAQGPVHRGLGLCPRAGRADQPLGARRIVHAGDRRLRPQRSPQGTAAALRGRRRVHHAGHAVSIGQGGHSSTASGWRAAIGELGIDPEKANPLFA